MTDDDRMRAKEETRNLFLLGQKKKKMKSGAVFI